MTDGHIVHVTVEPVAEDVVWCEICEEWVTSGPPEAAPVTNISIDDIFAEVRKHHVRIGVMASPGHWSYELKKAGGGEWFAMCSSDPRGGEVGCGWDSKPNNYVNRDEAWAAAHAHVAQAIKEALG